MVYFKFLFNILNKNKKKKKVKLTWIGRQRLKDQNLAC
jgi:hypothetical protein